MLCSWRVQSLVTEPRLYDYHIRSYNQRNDKTDCRIPAAQHPSDEPFAGTQFRTPVLSLSGLHCGPLGLHSCCCCWSGTPCCCHGICCYQHYSCSFLACVVMQHAVMVGYLLWSALRYDWITAGSCWVNVTLTYFGGTVHVSYLFLPTIAPIELTIRNHC